MLFFDDDPQNFKTYSSCPNVIPVHVAPPSTDTKAQTSTFITAVVAATPKKDRASVLEHIDWYLPREDAGLCMRCIKYYTDFVNANAKNLLALIFDFDLTLSVHSGLLFEFEYATYMLKTLENEEKYRPSSFLLENVRDKFSTQFEDLLKEEIFGSKKRANALIELFTRARDHGVPIFVLTSAPVPALQCKILTILGFPGIEGCMSVSSKEMYTGDAVKGKRTWKKSLFKSNLKLAQPVLLANLPGCSPDAKHPWREQLPLWGSDRPLSKYDVIEHLVQECLEQKCGQPRGSWAEDTPLNPPVRCPAWAKTLQAASEEKVFSLTDDGHCVCDGECGVSSLFTRGRPWCYVDNFEDEEDTPCPGAEKGLFGRWKYCNPALVTGTQAREQFARTSGVTLDEKTFLKNLKHVHARARARNPHPR